MKLIIEIKESERGDVAVDIRSNEQTEPTRKEKCYAINIIDLLKLELPKLTKVLGGKGVIDGVIGIKELEELSIDIDRYMHWAQVWHGQAGGYMASDTQLVAMRMERWAKRLTELTGKPESPFRKIADQ